MRRAAKVDRNQAEIVEYFRSFGASVAHTHMVGQGFPDIVVGYQGRNFLVEIKDAKKPPSKRKLTPDEAEWHANWRGNVTVVMCAADVEQLVNIWRLEWRAA